jgi:hypothetical protein
VQVVSSTWARDSHDLFDFEAHHLHTKAFTVDKSVTFVRNGTDVVASADNSSVVSEPLLRLVQKDGSFWVDKASSSSSSKKLWQVVRDLADRCHTLAENDVMKLGRFKFRVRQMVSSASSGTQPELKVDDSLGECSCMDEAELGVPARICRICLTEGTGSGEDYDPLIRPCQCKGSIEFVHLGCLRHWIKNRLSLSENPSGSYFYRPLSCELCRSTYPTYINNGTERQTLVEVPHTAAPFIVLENMVRDSQQHNSRGLHVISLADNKLLKLGRGHESDIRIADVSISRCHATVRFQRGKFLLEDHDSKFGTLVAMRKPRALEPGSRLSIQVGRSVLSLSLEPRKDAPQELPFQTSL